MVDLDAPVIGRNKGQPLRDVKRAWAKVRKAAKLPDEVRLYDVTKHTLGDYLVQAGAADSVIGDVLGASPKTVQVYRVPSAYVQLRISRRDKVAFAGDDHHPVIEVTVVPRANSRPVCSGCRRRRPGYDRLTERHEGRAQAILEARTAVYEKARQRHPERWARGTTRAWVAPQEVLLNPAKHTRLGVAQHAVAA